MSFKMGGILMAGGVIGSSLGVALFSFLRSIGQIDPSCFCPMWCSWGSSDP